MPKNNFISIIPKNTVFGLLPKFTLYFPIIILLISIFGNFFYNANI